MPDTPTVPQPDTYLVPQSLFIMLLYTQNYKPQLEGTAADRPTSGQIWPRGFIAG